MDTNRGLYALPKGIEEYLREYEELLESLRNSGQYPEDHGIQEEFTRIVLSQIEEYLSKWDDQLVHFQHSRDYSVLHSVMVHSYIVPDFDVSPIFLLDAERSSGKSTVLDYLAAIAYRAFKSTSVSAASLPQLVDSYHVSMLLAEGTKNLKSRAYGEELSNVLIDGFIENEAKYVRVGGEHNEKVTVRYHYTMVAGTLLEDCPPDLRDRAVIMPLAKSPSDFKPLKIFKLDTAEVEERMGPLENIVMPEEIRSRLYALRILKTCYEVKGTPSPFSMAPFKAQAKRYLRKKDIVDGKETCLYGLVYGFDRTPTIARRAEDISLVYLPIAMAMGTDRDVMEAMVDRVADNSDIELTTESTILRGLMEVVRGVVRDNSLKGDFDGPLEWSELASILKDVSTKQVNAMYREIRNTRDNWEEKQMEDPRTITAIIRRMRLDYNTGTSGCSFFIPGDGFRKALRTAVLSYGGNEVKGYFSKV